MNECSLCVVHVQVYVITYACVCSYVGARARFQCFRCPVQCLSLNLKLDVLATLARMFHSHSVSLDLTSLRLQEYINDWAVLLKW